MLCIYLHSREHLWKWTACIYNRIRLNEQRLRIKVACYYYNWLLLSRHLSIRYSLSPQNSYLDWPPSLSSPQPSESTKPVNCRLHGVQVVILAWELNARTREGDDEPGPVEIQLDNTSRPRLSICYSLNGLVRKKPKRMKTAMFARSFRGKLSGNTLALHSLH